MEQFYVKLDDDDIDRINSLLRERWALTNLEKMDKNLQDRDLSPELKQKITSILKKEPSEELITLLTFYARKLNRFMEFRTPLTAANARIYFDEAIEAVDKVSRLIEPFQLMKYSTYTDASLEESKAFYLERNVAIARTILEDTLKLLAKTRDNLPKSQKGNRDKKAEALMQAAFTAKVYKAVEAAYKSDDLMKREKNTLVLNVTAELLKLVKVTPAGVFLNTPDAKNRFNAVIKTGMQTIKSKAYLDSEEDFLFFM